MTRATIARVEIWYAQSVGIVINNGWINRVEGCSLQHCGIGIKAFGEVNSVDMLNNIIEHGSLAGIVVFSGMNMNIQGNCIEGTEGPGIVSSNMDSLTIANNYFETNNDGNASCHECPGVNVGQISGPLVLKPMLFSGKLPADAPGPITVFCDIVLTGALAAGTACMYVHNPLIPDADCLPACCSHALHSWHSLLCGCHSCHSDGLALTGPQSLVLRFV